ncbi:hypothetical protein IAT38_007843 [Cryptococcus sp. DSM 104549]
MPHIRKKTSNRQNTRDRAKIHKKASEQKRKNKKAGKKDQQWKSKKKADPGVPNSFPFKDQVLAELAEERRKAEEDKIAHREALKASKNQEEEPEADTPGINSVGRNVLPRVPLTATSALPVAVSEEPEIPELIDTALPTLQEALDRADVVCEVVDARDILGCRSGYVEGLVKEAEGRIVLIVNKIDLVPRETLETWLARLSVPAFLFKSALPAPPSTASSSKTPAPVFSVDPTVCLGRDQLFAAIKKWSAEKKKAKKSAEPLVLALMGLPSVGKTSVLNSLVPATKRKYPTAPLIPTAQAAKSPEPVTKRPVEVVIDVEGLEVRVIDTPGWEQAEEDPEELDEENEEDEDEEEDPEKWDVLEARLAGDLLRRNLGRVDKVKDAFPLVNYIIKRSNHQDLMLAYNIPFFESGDVEAFLLGLARAQGRIRKHGVADLEAAARIVLRDWAHNTFPYYSTPPPASSSMDVDGTAAESYDMSAVLAQLKGKKEMKKASGKGLIRFKGGEVDSRDVILDDDYTAMAAPSDSEDEDDDEEDDDDELDDDEEDELEGSDDEGILIGSDDGEELELEDGPEPSSGSDLEDDEDDEEDEEESSPEPPSPPKAAPAKGKKRRISEAPSVAAPVKKAKRVSFAKSDDVAPLKKFQGAGKKGKGRK